MADRYDAVVVGGGPAGSATATLLARQGRRVLLVDRARFPRRKACAEYISPGGVDILYQLGLDLERAGRRLSGMQVRAPDGTCHTIGYESAGQPRTGLSIDRAILDTSLLDVARDAGVEVREGCRVAAATRLAGPVDGVALADGARITSSLVVGADGLHSVVARAVGGVRPRRWPSRLGLTAHLHGVDWPEATGQLWVGQRGYVGIAPLDHAGAVTVGAVVPFGSRRNAEALFAAGLAEHPALAARLARGQRVGPVLGAGPLARRPARLAGPGYVLVGDAAGFFDPFTGEGIFRALRGAQLAATLADDPLAYIRGRRATFAAKARLTAVIQAVVQTPRLLSLALRRLRERPTVARQLGNMLGDLEPARLRLAWQLFGP